MTETTENFRAEILDLIAHIFVLQYVAKNFQDVYKRQRSQRMTRGCMPSLTLWAIFMFALMRYNKWDIAKIQNIIMMKIIEVLKFNRELIKRLKIAGIRLEDEEFVDLYTDYTCLLYTSRCV